METDYELECEDADMPLARRSTWSAEVRAPQLTRQQPMETVNVGQQAFDAHSACLQEDNRLKQLVRAYGAANWSVIAQVRELLT